MIFTAPMKLLTAVILEKDSEEVTKELLRQSVLDFVSVKELSGGWKTSLGSVSPAISLAKTGELRKRIEGFLNLASPPLNLPDPDIDSLESVDLEKAEKTLDSLAAEINGIRERQRLFQEEILKLEEIRRQVETFEDLKTGAAARSTYSFLSLQTGTVPQTRMQDFTRALESFPSVLIPSKETEELRAGVLLITMKRDDPRIAPILSQNGWEDVSLPADLTGSKGDALKELREKVEGLRSQQKACTQDLQDLLVRRGEKLRELWTGLRIKELFTRIQANFSRTDRTFLFSGWLPAEKQAVVETGIRRASGNRCFIEWTSPRHGEAREIETPVEMRNPKVLKPFEMLVKNYALPEYGAIDPTPFVAVSYLVMFGLMFGDAGHGLVLLIIGLLGIRHAAKKGKKDNLFRLITYCGGAAIITGILFGSYFGVRIFPALWFDFHGIISGHSETPRGLIQDIYDILGITIKFGIAVLGSGLILNWINLVRKKEWLRLVLDKGGILGGWIYGAGVWAAFYFVGHEYKGLPPGSLLFWLLGVPTILLALKGPAEIIHHSRKTGEKKKFGALMIMDCFMEWIVEILEIYSGYLANTLSFMRVAGLGIAHVSLMIAFFQIAGMLGTDGGFSLWSYVILIFGNVLVIALEGLSAGIQSLRLNYYEFFSKYFTGTGKAYRPISLRGRD